MKEKIYTEMMVNVAVCTHKEPKEILIISNDASNMLDEIAKYKTINAKAINTDINLLREENDNRYDIVISEIEMNSVSIAHINRVLKDDALAVFVPFNLKDVEQTTHKLKEIGRYFKIVMPYNILSHNKAVLASKEYHPTADIILQRADLRDGFEVYNSDLHIASFAMPTFVKKAYLGIIKN